MTTILFACAVLAATLLVAAVFLLGRRSGSSAEAKAGRGRGADRRADAGDGAGPLAARSSARRRRARRSRALGDLAGTIDLDEVVARTLDAVEHDGWRRRRRRRRRHERRAADGGRRPRVRAHGVPIVGPPDGSQPRSISVEYDYGPDRGDEPVAIRAGARGPARQPGRAARLPLGVLPHRTVTRSARRAPPSSRSSRSAPGRRSTTPSAFARPASSPISTRSRASTTAATSTRRSPARSPAPSATTGSLALVVFDLDDFKAINDRIGHLAGDSVLAEAAERVRDVVRAADVACRVGGDEFAVILPESSLGDADQLYKRLEQALSARPVAECGTVAPLGRRHGVAPGRRRDLVLRAGRRGALPRQGRGQGHGRRDRDAYAAAARGARNGIQLVSGTVPTSGDGRGRSGSRRARAPGVARPRPHSARRARRGGGRARSRGRASSAGSRPSGGPPDRRPLSSVPRAGDVAGARPGRTSRRTRRSGPRRRRGRADEA